MKDLAHGFHSERLAPRWWEVLVWREFFEDGTMEELDKDCTFTCRDLSNLSAQSADDVLYSG